MVDIVDKSGQPPSQQDVAGARKVIAKAMVLWIGKLPPELGVELGNIARCLKYLEEIMPK